MARNIHCSMCGKKFDMWDASENFHIHKNMGFGTKYDGERIEINLCCACMEKLIVACTLSPVVKG